VERSGQARSMVVDNLKLKTMLPFLQANIDREARVMTDDAGQYLPLHKHFPAHGVVNHSAGEYVSRIDGSIHTNTVEGFFSVFKRGMKGVDQHCGHNHLSRYMAEFDFRYNNRIALGVNDHQRAELLSGVVGKRDLSNDSLMRSLSARGESHEIRPTHSRIPQRRAHTRSTERLAKLRRKFTCARSKPARSRGM
jgi:hypothetical protein